MNTGAIIIGLLLFVNGILVLCRRRFGPEEGMRGNLFVGNTAIFAGVTMIVMGVALLYVGIASFLSGNK